MCRAELGGVIWGTNGRPECVVVVLLLWELILTRQRRPSFIRRTAVAWFWSSVYRIEDGAS